jgi:hypothetical protein
MVAACSCTKKTAKSLYGEDLSMDSNPQAHRYLIELYQMTAGDAGTQVSMYAVGTAMGLEKAEAGKLAEELIGDGLAEVKTLSGGIGITAEGIGRVQADGAGEPATAAAEFDLGSGPVLANEAVAALSSFLTQIKTRLSETGATYDQLEEMVMDLKTIEVQLLSPRPKSAIVRETLHSLHSMFGTLGDSGLSERIGKIISNR